MLRQTRQFLALYLSTALLLTGHGLQLILLPLRAAHLEWSAAEIGLTGSAYFVGFLVGCFVIPRFVSSVGHIRVFSAVTTFCGIALLGVALLADPLSWCFLRFGTGVGISGAYVVIESWLNAKSSDNQRGRTMAVYTVLVLGAMSLGQLAVNVGHPGDIQPVLLGAILLTAAVLPLSLIRIEQPRRPKAVAPQPGVVLREAPAAVGAVFLVGLITSALFTVLPVAAVGMGFDTAQASAVMFAMIVGGAALQYPAGRLSDRFDRRLVLCVVCGLGMLAAGGLMVPGNHFALTVLVVFVVGGAASAVYPICLAHANDRIPGQFLSTGTTILLLNSLGAVIGPTLAALALDASTYVNGLFYMAGTVFLLALVWLVGCMRRREQPMQRDADFVVSVKSTPSVMEIDPRGHDLTEPR